MKHKKRLKLELKKQSKKYVFGTCLFKDIRIIEENNKQYIESLKADITKSNGFTIVNLNCNEEDFKKALVKDVNKHILKLLNKGTK